MSSDDFEKRVQSQSLRQIPPEWRAEILQAARAASAADRPARCADKPGLLATFISQLPTLLRLHPKTWAALAAVWVAIVAMNFYSADKTTAQVRKVSPPTAEMVLVMQNQRRELAELVRPADASDADRPRPFQPRPRSERRIEIPVV